MGLYFNPGNESFANIAKKLYVDKTGLIEYINGTLGTKDSLTCFSRPRRFGKSFAAKMLAAYYDQSCDSASLFKNMKIVGSTSFSEHLNHYYVLYLDITTFLAKTDATADVVGSITANIMQELAGYFPNIVCGNSLIERLVAIAERTEKKFFIIIDEWDAIFREAKENTQLQKAYILFLRSLFKNSVLTGKAIVGAYMTGILPIKKYGTESALTDFREYTMTSPGRLAEYIGFTEKEVKQICREHRLSFAKVKKWYDGYAFNRYKSIYNPNSVMEAVRTGEVENFWTRTETYEALQRYIDLDADGLKQDIVQLIAGAYKPIDIGTFQNDLTSIKSKDDVLTLLVHLGYLAYASKTNTVHIPNEEIKKEFLNAIKSPQYTELYQLIVHSRELLEATCKQDEKAVAQCIEEVHDLLTTAEFYNNEQALRNVIRFAYIVCLDEYLKIEELPSGKGYADVVFLPRKASSAVPLVIELKWNHSVDGALKQIKERNYLAVLKNYHEVLCVGINYDEKTKKHCCKIERITYTSKLKLSVLK